MRHHTRLSVFVSVSEKVKPCLAFRSEVTERLNLMQGGKGVGVGEGGEV